MREKVLVVASVASMIDQFNMPNIKLLKEMGYEVHVACNFIEGNTCSIDRINNLKDSLFNLDVLFHQVDFKRNILQLLGNIYAYIQVYKLVNDYQYKFIHCHSPIGGVVGRLVGKTTSTKIVYTVHGFHFYEKAPLLNWFLYYPIEKWLSRITDVLITINKEDENLAKSRLKSKKVFYVPGVGVATKFYKENIVDIPQKKEELLIPQNATIMLSVGELNKNKNHEVVIRSLNKIGIENIHYIICGQGPLKSHLEKLIKDMQLENNVHLVGFREDIKDIYKIADLFLLPSYREGLSVALMEAMASGLPVICSKIRGNIDLITEDSGGYFFNPTDYLSLAEKMYQILNNAEKMIEMGNFNLIESKKYDVQHINSMMTKIYQELN